MVLHCNSQSKSQRNNVGLVTPLLSLFCFASNLHSASHIGLILSLFRSIRRCGRSTLLHHGTGSHHTHTQSARNDTILL